MTAEALHVGVELGGTKIVVASSNGGRRLLARRTIATDTPDQTLGSIREAIRNLTGGRTLDGIGIGTFGPVDLRRASDTYGHLLNTPKPGWSGVDVFGAVGGESLIPASIDTDVNAALLGEHTWGAATAENTGYLTIGTGIGGAVWTQGRILRGENHPEIGHVHVPRHPDDLHPSTCPYHETCLEGMTSGPSILARWGKPAESLGTDTEAAVAMSAWYVAQGIAVLCAVIPVTQVVIGGGVSKLPGFHAAVAAHLPDITGSYPPVPFAEGGPEILPPGLGDDSGVIGAIELARAAADLQHR